MSNLETKKFDELPYEFVLSINNKIICQRFFNIKGLNENTTHFSNLKELADAVCGISNGEYGLPGIIPSLLKNKTYEYLWENYNPYVIQNQEDIKVQTEKNDEFQFEIKVKKRTIMKTAFSANYYPPRVRYAVDIKEIIPNIISEIKYYLLQDSSNKQVA
jgi:hypothetical protein